MIYRLLRNLLFLADAETSHDVSMALLSYASKNSPLTSLISLFARQNSHTLKSTVMDIEFPNPVGLAPGLDKQASACNALSALGFGWIELGTVTPLPQPGNPKPRLFRLTDYHAIINRMGFNSTGLDVFLKNISTCNPSIIKGINIGKNAATSMEHAIDDYLICLNAVYDYADYITINISSPNTKNLRDLQNEDELSSLLRQINQQRLVCAEKAGRRVPLVLKIAPDLNQEQIEIIASLSRLHEIDGIAATNTTLSREGVQSHQFGAEVGGLSGQPLAQQSTYIIQQLYQNLQGEIPIMGLGGIDSPQAAWDKLSAGADLIQLYTGFIYKGPKLIKEINESIERKMEPHPNITALLQSSR